MNIRLAHDDPHLALLCPMIHANCHDETVYVPLLVAFAYCYRLRWTSLVLILLNHVVLLSLMLECLELRMSVNSIYTPKFIRMFPNTYYIRMGNLRLSVSWLCSEDESSSKSSGSVELRVSWLLKIMWIEYKLLKFVLR